MYPYRVVHRENQRRPFFLSGRFIYYQCCALYIETAPAKKKFGRKKIYTNYTDTVYFYAYQ